MRHFLLRAAVTGLRKQRKPEPPVFRIALTLLSEPRGMLDPESIYQDEDEVLEASIRNADEERERIQQENDMLEYYLSKNRCVFCVEVRRLCALSRRQKSRFLFCEFSPHAPV